MIELISIVPPLFLTPSPGPTCLCIHSLVGKDYSFQGCKLMNFEKMPVEYINGTKTDGLVQVRNKDWESQLCLGLIWSAGTEFPFKKKYQVTLE